MACRVARTLDPTRDTIMEVAVEEDWRRTVARMPIMIPATGLVSSPNKSPAVQPPMTLADEPSSSNPTKKKYRKNKRNSNATPMAAHSSAVWQQHASKTSFHDASVISL